MRAIHFFVPLFRSRVHMIRAYIHFVLSLTIIFTLFSSPLVFYPRGTQHNHSLDHVFPLHGSPLLMLRDTGYNSLESIPPVSLAHESALETLLTPLNKVNATMWTGYIL